MKYFLIICLIWIVFSGCEKEEIIINHISFEIDGEEFQCNRDFYCSGSAFKDFLEFSGKVSDMSFTVVIHDFHGKGEYPIDFYRHISIFRESDSKWITTSDVLDKPQGSGNITIQKISNSGVSGTFECISLDNIHITNGKFQLRRE